MPRARWGDKQLRQKNKQLRAALTKAAAALAEADEYFDQRADAEYFTDSAAPVGNEEMRILTEIRDALAACSGQQQEIPE